jgi:putative spermidine/putrescine transport system ATP-binding protein
MQDAVSAGTSRGAPSDLSAAVGVRNVSMTFSGVHAVRDVSFDVPRGQFLTILGPSGSGKTTLLRLIAGFETPTAGEIVINGRAVSAVPAHKRSIGMVFQRLALFPHMTAEQNIAFPLTMRRTDARRIPERVERYLDLVQLGGLGGRRVHELSGGQQQRVAIARALVFEPDLLLLDEPLAALDRKLREEMQLEFRRIQRELGVTTINVTHDQREALVVSDEIIVMDGGEIQQKAHPAETYRQPKNPFVAGFIGVTNFISGRLVCGPGEVAIVTEGGTRIGGRVGDPSHPPVNGSTGLGVIRAEQVRLAPAEGVLAGLETIIAGVVTDAIFEGARVVYEIHPADLPGKVFRAFDHDPAGHARFEIGKHIVMGWNDRDVLVFND